MRIAAPLFCLLLVACSADAPPPKADTDAATSAPAADTDGDDDSDADTAPEEHTELRDAMQAPIDKAKAVDEVREQSDEEQRKAIEDAGG